MGSDRLEMIREQPRLLRRLAALALAVIAASVLACGVDSADSQPPADAPSTRPAASVPSPTPRAPTATPRPTERAGMDSFTPTEVPAPTPTIPPSSRDRGGTSPALQALVMPTQTAPPDRDLVDLAVRFRGAEIDDSAPEPAEPMSVGERRDFWLTALDDGATSTISATLRVVSENAYWFADDALEVDQAGLERAARMYERRVRPAVVSAFGDIRSPGIDGDPRLVVLHSALDGAAGYYSSKDAFPVEVHPSSNEREIIYLNAEYLEPGSPSYMSVLAHEFQHAVHFNQDEGEESWVNEGLSMVAPIVAGVEEDESQPYIHPPYDAFLRSPDTQLNYWPEQPRSTIPHYDASALFFGYLAQRIGGTERLKDLVTERRDGVAGVDAFLRTFGLRFEDVFADWVVANYLDADDERYGYLSDDVRIRRALPLGDGKGREMSLPQFSARYHTLRTDAAEGTLRFQGDREVRQVGEECVSESGCWWSGRGDSINTKLTRGFDLTGLDGATLEYLVWHDIEDGWDYGYVEVSADGGRTWNILEGLHTSDEDVSGNAYGPGYTGRSRDWKRESVDLTPFAGGPVLVRFEYVTDDAVYRDGFMVGDVSVPELGDGVAADGWEAEGFALARESLPQRFVVQVIAEGGSGEFEVSRLELDDENFGEMILSGLDRRDREVVVVVSPITPDTRHGARYTLEFRAR